MSSFLLVVLVAAGGAAGSVARYFVGFAAAAWLGSGFPSGTLFVNVIGSLLMGIAASLLAARTSLQGELKALLMAGFLGGFTTFSAFSLDLVTLAERDAWMSTFVYLLASVGLSVAALLLGVWLTRAALG